MSPITTHVLDTALGRPAAGVTVVLERMGEQGPRLVSRGETNRDGRIADLMEAGTLEGGTYRMTFLTGAYFEATDRTAFYPQVTVDFTIEDPAVHYHVPLLLSPYGYSTYRGS